MKLRVKHAGGELEVASQKELTHLWQVGVVDGDDLVLREGTTEWVPAKELPWLKGTIATQRSDNRAFWWAVVLAVLGLIGVLVARGQAGAIAKKVVEPTGRGAQQR